MTTKNEKTDGSKGWQKCTQSKAKESKPAASNKNRKRNNLIFRQYEV